MAPPSSSFTIRRVNCTTFLIIERDTYGEHPYIYAKVHPSAPILVLNDTGCNKPAKEYEDADIIHLRTFLETYPVPENDDKPVNPDGLLTYVIIFSHCHYDHIGGIEQFLKCTTTKTEIIASAAGRDFIESDLSAHSLCKHAGIRTPEYKVTHWAQSNERLVWPLRNALPGDEAACENKKPVDLDMMMIQTPGHTPDSLSWFDYGEGTVYVGDSFYRLSHEMEPIIFPPQGDLVSWLYSLRRIAEFVFYNGRHTGDLHDAELTDWVEVHTEIKLSAAHTTCNVPANRCLMQAEMFRPILISNPRKPDFSREANGELYDYFFLPSWVDNDPAESMSMFLPRRLLEEAKFYYGGVQPGD